MTDTMTTEERERRWAHNQPDRVERICRPLWLRGELCEHGTPAPRHMVRKDGGGWRCVDCGTWFEVWPSDHEPCSQYLLADLKTTKSENALQNARDLLALWQHSDSSGATRARLSQTTQDFFDLLDGKKKVEEPDWYDGSDNEAILGGQVSDCEDIKTVGRRVSDAFARTLGSLRGSVIRGHLAAKHPIGTVENCTNGVCRALLVDYNLGMDILSEFDLLVPPKTTDQHSGGQK